jgi:hypothetical protein
VRVSKSEQLPEDGQVGLKHAAAAVILMSFYITETLKSFKLH